MRARDLVIAVVVVLALALALAARFGRSSDPAGEASPRADEPAAPRGPRAEGAAPSSPGPRPRATAAEPAAPARPLAATLDAERGRVAGSVRGPAGQPLAEAEVRARLEAAKDRRGEALARTDAEGLFALDGLTPGVYAVEARAPGLRPETVGGIEVEAGRAVEDLDFLLDAGALLEGSVVDAADGRPIRGATVRAHAPAELSGRALTRAREVRDPERLAETHAQTNDEGRFALRGLGAGTRFVSAKAPGYRTSEVATIEVRDGPMPPLELRLEGGAFIAGKVTDPAGAPAPGVRVTAEPEGGGPFGGGGGSSEGGEISTAEDGSYRVEGLAGSRFRVTAWPAGGLAPASRGRVRPNQDGVDLQLAAGASLAGIVIDALSKEPLAGATVDIGMPGLRRAATSAGDGSFAFDGLPAMRLELRAAHGRSAPHQESIELSAGEARAGVVIALGAGGTVVGQVLAADTRQPIAGAVVFASGDEQAQAAGGGRGGRRGGPGGGGPVQQLFLVEAMASGGDRAGAMPDGIIRELEGRLTGTDGQGRFEIANLPAGGVTVMAAHANHPGAFERATIGEAGGRAEVTLLLPPGGRIEGRVRDEEGRPVEHAVVFAFSFAGRARSAETDADGAYAIEGLFPGSYLANLGGFPGQPAGDGAAGFRSQTVNVEAGKVTRVDFGAEPQILVRGVVTRGGAPVASTGVQLLSTGGSVMFRPTETDDSGRFEARLPAGRYLAQVSGFSQPFEVVAGQDAVELALALPESAAAGRVIDLVTGLPLRAEVTLYHAARSERADTFAAAIGASAGSQRSSAEDGSFRVGGLAAGAYTLIARADGYADGRLEVTVPEGEATGIEVGLEPGGVLRGLVRGPDGAPVQATLWVVDADAADVPSGQPPRAEEDGTFELRRFAPGRYLFTALSETHAPWRRVIDFPGGELDLVIDLAAGGSLEVLVTRGGVPAPGALVELRYPDGDRVITGFADFLTSAQPTGPDGRLLRGRLPAGPLVGGVTAPPLPGQPEGGGAAAPFDVVITDGAAQSLTVALP